MKKLIILLVILGAAFTSISAQKIVYVDTQVILASLPEYQDAQKEIDLITERWQKQIQDSYDEIDRMYRAYQAEEIILSPDDKKKREEDIIQAEKELKDMQKAKFGHEGELFQKRKELVKPIQDKVYEAISKMAKQRAYDFVLDKSSGISILFANNEFDKTAEVMKSLGIETADD